MGLSDFFDFDNWTMAGPIPIPKKEILDPLVDWGLDTFGYLKGEEGAREAREADRYNYQRRYQWTMQDLKAAGLNPILAASSGFHVGSGVPQVRNAPAEGFQSLATARGGLSRGSEVRSMNLRRKVQSELDRSAKNLNEATKGKIDHETSILAVKKTWMWMEKIIENRLMVEKGYQLEREHIKTEVWKKFYNFIDEREKGSFDDEISTIRKWFDKVFELGWFYLIEEKLR